MIEPKNILPLFSSSVFEYNVDPSLYSKDKILDTIVRNYNKNPKRNKWDTSATLHHYFKDWDNDDYNAVDLETLIPIYRSIFNNFIGTVSPGTGYEASIENITVCADKTHTMGFHDHISSDRTIFTCIHYLSCDENSALLRLDNPSSFLIYKPITIEHAIQQLQHNTLNSGFFKTWDIKPVIDNLIIFPAYLRHRVLPHSDTNNFFRIAIVTNLRFTA